MTRRRTPVAVRIAALTFALAAFLPSPARADVLPNDWCAEQNIGKPCQNGGEKGDQRGTCAPAMCSHRGAPCDAGPTTPCPELTYACGQCEPKKGLCSVSAVGSSASGGMGWLGVLALAMTGSRRRR